MSSRLMTIENMKREGIKHEQELVKSFKENGFVACRFPASGASCPDLIAGDGDSIFVMEVKTTLNTLIKIRKKQIGTLNTFANGLKAKSFIAIKFINREDWRFLKIMDLKIHGKSYSIDYNTAMLEGIEFNQLISDEYQKRLI